MRKVVSIQTVRMKKRKALLCNPPGLLVSKAPIRLCFLLVVPKEHCQSYCGNATDSSHK